MGKGERHQTSSLGASFPLALEDPQSLGESNNCPLVLPKPGVGAAEQAQEICFARGEAHPTAQLDALLAETKSEIVAPFCGPDKGQGMERELLVVRLPRFPREGQGFLAEDRPCTRTAGTGDRTAQDTQCHQLGVPITELPGKVERASRDVLSSLQKPLLRCAIRLPVQTSD